MKRSTLLVILVLQAVLVSAAVAKGHAGAKKPCCSNCISWSGVYTCDDILKKCDPSCQKCDAVPTNAGTRYKCGDFLSPGCPCKTN